MAHTDDWTGTTRALARGCAGATALIVAACSAEPAPQPDEPADVTAPAPEPAPPSQAAPDPAPTAEPEPPAAASAEPPPDVRPQAWPVAGGGIARDPAVEVEVERLLAAMTLEEKVGQIIQADIASVTPADVAEYGLGSVLNGGGSAPGGDLRASVEEWLALADAFWDASVGPDGDGIPLMWGTDAVHGHANVVGATVFPHNIGLGAANDPDLVRRIAVATAREVAVTGLDWTFAPTLATPRDDRWGRTYEGYSESADIVAAYAREVVLGLQGEPGGEDLFGPDKVIATAKHFVGDGGTRDGIDQGETIATEEELRDIHAAGYPPAIANGVQTVMASFSSWNGRKMHGRGDLLTDVLVDRMGFDGFVIGDWNGHGQIAGCTPTDCPASVNAGVDMFMAPDSWRGLYQSTLADVRAGEIPLARLNEAAARVLRVKVRYGLWDKGRPSSRPLAGQMEELGSPAHRALAREAVRKSLVLLKNEDALLPLSPASRVLVAGDGADDIGKQSGGWTISWQGDGNTNADFPGGQSIYAGVAETVAAAGGVAELSLDGSFTERPDVAIVVFGEDPYAEFQGDLGSLDYVTDRDADLALLRRLQADGVPTVSVFLSGRPLWVNPELNASDAFVAAWLPGSQGGAIADALFADAEGNVRHDMTGRLSFSWPRRPDQFLLNREDPDYDPLFAYGFGLSYGDDATLPPLREDFVVETQASDLVFGQGAPRANWRLQLRSGDGVATLVDAPNAATSDGALLLDRVDRRTQEDTLALTWTGDAPAALAVIGSELDWSRQANGDMTLRLEYRLDAPLTDGVSLAMECGEGCVGAVTLDADDLDAPVGAWGAVRVRLACFAANGADPARITAPLVLRSDAANALSLSDAALAPASEGGCPG